MPYFIQTGNTPTHTLCLSLSTHRRTSDTLELNDFFKKRKKKKRFHNFLKVKMSTLKSLEFFNNPQITTKHQNTPNMLLLLLSSVFSFLLHSYIHTFDLAVKTEQDGSVELPAAQQCSGCRN